MIHFQYVNHVTENVKKKNAYRWSIYMVTIWWFIWSSIYMVEKCLWEI